MYNFRIEICAAPDSGMDLVQKLLIWHLSVGSAAPSGRANASSSPRRKEEHFPALLSGPSVTY